MIMDRTTPVKGTKELIQDIMNDDHKYIEGGVVLFDNITVCQKLDTVQVAYSKGGVLLFSMETPGTLGTGDALSIGIDLGQIIMSWRPD